MSLFDNDDEAARPTDPAFAQGHVALILAESILHVLVERKVLTVEDAVSALQTTAEVKLAMAAGSGESSAQLQSAIEGLFRAMESFATDLGPMAQRKAKADCDHNLGTD